MSPSVEELPRVLQGILQEGDLLLTLGAGNIVQAGERLLEIWSRKNLNYYIQVV